MNVEGKSRAVRAWLATCPFIDDYVKLNAVKLEPGESSLVIDYEDKSNREFIGGVSERYYSFTLIAVADFSGDSDDVNESAMSFGEKWLDWVEAQHAAGNDPDFGPQCTIRAIESQQVSPVLDSAYQDEMLARYSFAARITYWEKG